MAHSRVEPRSAIPRHTAALLIGLAFFLTDLGGASAGAELSSLGQGITPEELSCDHEVRLDGLTAIVRTTQVIANPSDALLEIRYEFALPREAAVRALSVGLGERTLNGRVVQADAAISPTADPDAIEGRPDIALLRLVERGAPHPGARHEARYELVLFPIPARQSVRVTYEWVAPLALVDARVVLRIPERGAPANLVRERVRIATGEAPYGKRFAAAQLSGGAADGVGKRAGYLAPSRGDLVIEAATTPTRSGAPWVRATAAPLTASHGVITLEVAAGAPHLLDPRSWERVIVVADLSRSLGAEGIAAIRTLTGALLGAVAQTARAEVIVFDRRARAILGDLVSPTPASIKAVDDAIAASPMANGSDLGEALGLVRTALAADGPASTAIAPTLIVVLTDGNLPRGQSVDRLRLRLGDDVLATATMTTVFIAHDEAPLVDVEASPLAALSMRSGGRALIVRHEEAALRARTLAKEVARPAPILLEGLSADGEPLRVGAGALSFEAGTGGVILATYLGAAPRKLELSYRQGSETASLSTTLRKGARAAAPSLWLAGLLAQDFAAAAGVGETSTAKRALLAALSTYSTVSPVAGLVVLDDKDPFGKERLAALARAGAAAFTRLPPPPERAAGFRFVPFEDRLESTREEAFAPPSRTGELDREIIGRLFATSVVPRAKICYQNALRREPELGGRFTIIAEIIAGEVHHAELEGSTFADSAVQACVLDAVYAMTVPRVAQGATAEPLGVARYPLRLRRIESGEIEAYNPSAAEMRQVLEPSTPLGGLERARE